MGESHEVLRGYLLADLDHLARSVTYRLVVGLHVVLRNLLQLSELVLRQLQRIYNQGYHSLTYWFQA